MMKITMSAMKPRPKSIVVTSAGGKGWAPRFCA
jgi:hypothetical protein